MRYPFAIVVAASAAVCLQVAPLSAAPKGTDGMTRSATTEGQKPQAKDPAKAGDFETLYASYLADCMRDWDAATHMTRKEWQTTCQRVSRERAKFRTQDVKPTKQ